MFPKIPEKLHILIPLAYMTGIFALSSIPDTGGTEAQVDKIFHWISPELQNLLHIPLFGGLAGCWFWALRPWFRAARTRIVTAFIITMIFSLSDEYHQLSVPGRFGSFTDLGLNAIGSVLILAIIAIHHRNAQNHLL